MESKNFYNLRSLIRHVDNISADYDTVSFDLFDTLLIRRIHDPDKLKEPVVRFISAKARKLGLFWSWKRVLALRNKIEAEHRTKTGEKFEDHEACYSEYMKEVLAEIFEDKMPDDFLRTVSDYELAIENSMIVPRSELVKLLTKLHDQGKKIIVASDIYLPAEYLKKLIDHAGFLSSVTDVVSSADTFLAKASGKAFPMLKEKLDLDPARWLHIGDNPISDGLRPSEFGICSLVLKDSAERQRKAVVRRHSIFADIRLYWRGRFLQQLMLPLEDENKERSPLYIEGYNFFGPIIGAFIQKLAERTRELEIKKVYFLSREGWTFKNFWEKATPVMYPDGRLPETSYLYVSRMALAGAACAYQGLTQDNADIAFLPPGNRDMRDLCRVFSLDIKSLLPFMSRYELAEDDPLSRVYPGFSKKQREKLLDLLDDQEFQTEVKRQTRPYNDAVQRYLEKEHFFDQDDVAIVDVGWLGTIQRFLYESVQHRDDKPNFHGFLLGASRGIPYPTRPNNYIEGIIFDRNQFDFAASTLLYARDVFEEACRAPHAGLDAYKLSGDDVELVFRSEDDASAKAEALQTEYFAPLQQGIMDAAERYGAASAVTGFEFKEIKPWLNNLLVSKLAFPKAREVAVLRQKHHLDDFYGKHKPPKSFQRVQKHLWDYSIWELRINPFARLRFYLIHALMALRK